MRTVSSVPYICFSKTHQKGFRNTGIPQLGQEFVVFPPLNGLVNKPYKTGGFKPFEKYQPGWFPRKKGVKLHPKYLSNHYLADHVPCQHSFTTPTFFRNIKQGRIPGIPESSFWNERIGLKMTRGGVSRATSPVWDFWKLITYIPRHPSHPPKIPSEDRCLEPLTTRTSGDVCGFKPRSSQGIWMSGV